MGGSWTVGSSSVLSVPAEGLGGVCCHLEDVVHLGGTGPGGAEAHPAGREAILGGAGGVHAGAPPLEVVIGCAGNIARGRDLRGKVGKTGFVL